VQDREETRRTRRVSSRECVREKNPPWAALAGCERHAGIVRGQTYRTCSRVEMHECVCLVAKFSIYISLYIYNVAFTIIVHSPSPTCVA
jgi:hypothetical protein